MKKIVSAAIAAMFTFSIGLSTAMAADEGNYMVVNVGVSPLTSSGNSYSGWGAGIGAGHNFNQYFGVEAFAGFFGIGSSLNLNTISLSGSLLGYLPVSDDIRVFGKIGESETLISTSTGGASGNGTAYNGLTSLYGAGIMIKSNDTLNYRIGYEHYDLGIIPGLPLTTNYIYVGALRSF